MLNSLSGFNGVKIQRDKSVWSIWSFWWLRDEGIFAFAKNGAVACPPSRVLRRGGRATPRIFVQFHKVFYNACSQRVEMNVADQF
jgi:hypothetical protein